LDLGAIPDADRKALGTTLANKLDAVLRALHLDLTAIPDAWDAPRQSLGDDKLRVELIRQKDGTWRVGESTVAALPTLFDKLGRIVLARRTEDQHKGDWLFTTDTVRRTEAMFRTVAGRPIDPSLRDLDEVIKDPSSWEVPGIWLRLRLPAWARRPVGPLDA